MTSIRGTQWQRFAAEVADHIEKYTVPQYGDEGEDIITDQTAEYCIDHAKRYLARFGRSARPGTELLDLKKAAHYLQMAHDKLADAPHSKDSGVAE